MTDKIESVIIFKKKLTNNPTVMMDNNISQQSDSFNQCKNPFKPTKPVVIFFY